MIEKNHKPDKYYDLLQRDFCLGIIEVNGVEGDFSRKPWIKGTPHFSPHCLFERKDGFVYYFFSEKGIKWLKSQLEKRFKEDQDFAKVISREFRKYLKPVENILKAEKALSLAKLKVFCEDMKNAWPWFEALWWGIELFEEQKDKKNLNLLLECRRKHENFVPSSDKVIRKSLKKAYPEFEKYIDVILLEEAFSGKLPDRKKLEKRLRDYFYAGNKLYAGKNRGFFEKKYNIKIQEHSARGNGGVIQGKTAFGGYAKGKVKKILKLEDVRNFKKGEILAAPTTLPEYLPAIKKASAIIANEGGLLSHAAIISRELKIPCVIGTKAATSVLKDGDLVEVDADKGVVRIIDRI